MSSVDINSIVSLLESTKIRARSDGLDLLEQLCSSPMKITNKQFSLLTKSIVHLIEYEVKMTQPGSTTESRIVRGAYCLRLIIENTLDRRFKPKGCINVMHDTLILYKLIQMPDFLKVFTLLLKQQYIKDNLSYDQWLEFHNTIMKLVKSEDQEHLLNELIDCLNEILVGSDDGNITCFLHPSDIDVNDVLEMFKLKSGFISKSCKISITMFKIITKLLIVIDGYNFQTTIDLIGFNFELLRVLNYNFNNNSLLNKYIIIFINLDSMHCLITNHTSYSRYTQWDPILTMLIEKWLHGFLNTNNQVNPENIGFHQATLHKTWFQMETIYLKNVDATNWCFASGLTKLIRTYYCIKNQAFSGNYDDDLKPLKKQKLHTSYITDFLHSVELFNDLLQKTKTKSQNAALQLLIFHLEMYGLHDIDFQNNTDESTALETIGNINISFSALLSTGQSEKVSLNSLIIIIGNSLNRLIWNIIALNSFIVALMNSSLDLPFDIINQLLKFCLPLVRETYSSDVIAITIGNLTRLIKSKNYSFINIVDDSLRNQLESLIHLSEVSGPSNISNSAFDFWMALYNVVKSYGFKSEVFQDKVKNWLLAKWDTALEPNSSTFCLNIENLPTFLCWLISYKPPHRWNVLPNDMYQGDLLSIFNDSVKCHSFYDFRFRDDPSNEFDYRDMDIFEEFEVIGHLDDLLFRYLELKDFVHCSLVVNLVHFALLSSNIYVTFLHHPSYKNYIISIESILTTVFHDITPDYSKTDILKVVQVINCLDWNIPICDGLAKSLYYLLSSVKPDKLRPIEEKSNVFLENEFAQHRVENHRIMSIDNFQRCQNLDIELLKALLNLKKINGFDVHNMLQASITYIDSLDNESGLYCLFILISGEIPIHILDHEHLIQLARVLGERLLTNTLLSLNELTVVTIMKYIAVILSKNGDKVSSSLLDDTSDLCNWIFDLKSRNFILSNNSEIEYMKLLLSLISSDNELQIKYKKPEIYDLFFQTFQQSPIRRIALISKTNQYLKYQDTKKQNKFYSDLTRSFDLKIEEIRIEFCQYLSSLSLSYLRLTTSVTFNLLELLEVADSETKNVYEPLVDKSLSRISSRLKLNSSRQILMQARNEIFRSWWIHKGSYDNFPYSLFQYPLLNEFYKDNLVYIIAIVYAKSGNVDIPGKVFTKEEIRNSFILAIPLAYVTGGIRNQIHQVCSQRLKDEYHDFMLNNISLIIFELLKLMDLSNEKTVSDVMSRSINSNFYRPLLHIVDDPMTTISFRSGFELMELLLKNFGGSKMFWNHQILYFLIQKFLVLVDSSFTDTQKILQLRKIKFVLALGTGEDLEFPLLKLVFTKVVLLLRNECLNESIQDLLRCLDIKMWSEYSEEETLALVIPLISNLTTSAKKIDFTILDSIITYSQRRIGSSPLSALLVDVCYRLRNGSSTEKNWIEPLFYDKQLLQKTKIDDSYIYLLQMLSILFQYGEYSRINSGSLFVSEVLLGNKIEDYHQNFKLWAMKQLGKYYIEDNISFDSEVVNLNELDACVNDTRYLGQMILVMLKEDTNDFGFSCFVDNIIGKYVSSKHTFIKNNVRIFSDQGLICGDRIISIDHIFPYVPDYIDPFSTGYYQEHEESIIKDLGDLKFQDWSSLVCLKLLKSLPEYLFVFQELIFHYNFLSFKLLPYLVCCYVDDVEASYVDMIISELAVKAEFNRDACETLLKLLFLIRFRSKQNHTRFKHIYCNLNIGHICGIISGHKFFKSALLFLEDDFSETQKDWKSLPYISQIFESIDDDDLAYGLPEETTFGNAIKKIYRTENPSESMKFSLAEFDSYLSLNQEADSSSVLSTMMQNSFLGTSSIIGRTMSYSDRRIDKNHVFEWSWKLNQWNIPIPSSPNSNNEFIYKALKLIHDYPDQGTRMIEDIMLSNVDKKDSISKLKLSPKELKLKTEEVLQCFGTLHAISCIFDPNPTITFTTHNQLERMENMILARNVAFQICAEREKHKWFQSLNELVLYNEMARDSGHEQKMINSTALINQIIGTKLEYVDDTTKQAATDLSNFVSAQTFWNQNQTSMAISMMKNIQDDIHLPGGISILKSKVQALLVQWMAYSRQELPSIIYNTYVEPTYQSWLVKGQEDPESYKMFAEFCEDQSKSRNLNNQIIKLEKQVNGKRQEMDDLKSHYSKTTVHATERKGVQKYYSKLKAQYNSEVSDLDNAKTVKNNFNVKAVEFYLRGGILVGSSDEELIDKFFSLWLEDTSNDEINQIISDLIMYMPKYRLVSWASQLISRLSSEVSLSQKVIQELVIQLCEEHPYHCLYHLISLIEHGAHVEANYDKFMISKVNIAKSLWSRIDKGGVETHIREFCHKAVELSKYKVARGKTLNLDKVTSLGTYWVNGLSPIPPPTYGLPLDPTKEYKDIPLFHQIDTKVSIAKTGLSLPKIARFILTNGKEHRIILKHGSDDLRQDAIMEQVFERVNKMFTKDKSTRKRQLRVRTYKIVPIGPRSGVIEFVNNSKALIDILRPYHSEHDQMSFEKARELMKDCQDDDRKERVRIYSKICQQVKPRLRLFFSDTFLTPDSWFDSKVTYSHGLATSSIVGYILGLGDRHCNNILLDKSTGEPIHIDLGVAFDQGKRLPIPETVPFRLTRDLVDGLGITGPEGIFRKSCEHTFRVLRDSQVHILAILDILRWDPLYSWSLSPLRQKRLQDGDEGYQQKHVDEDISEAGRAVSTVKDKLIANGLNPEAVIRELIQQARDDNNLALIYCGWCPFF